MTIGSIFLFKWLAVNDVRELFPLPLFNGTILLFPMIETGYEDTRNDNYLFFQELLWILPFVRITPSIPFFFFVRSPLIPPFGWITTSIRPLLQVWYLSLFGRPLITGTTVKPLPLVRKHLPVTTIRSAYPAQLDEVGMLSSPMLRRLQPSSGTRSGWKLLSPMAARGKDPAYI